MTCVYGPFNNGCGSQSSCLAAFLGIVGRGGHTPCGSDCAALLHEAQCFPSAGEDVSGSDDSDEEEDDEEGEEGTSHSHAHPNMRAHRIAVAVTFLLLCL